MKKYVVGLASITVLFLLTFFQSRDISAVTTTEVEDNNSYATANILGVNNAITGNISLRKDKDYYVVKPPSNGRLSLSFKHTYQDSNDRWTIDVYMYDSGEYTCLTSSSILLKDAETITLPTIGTKKGAWYYVVIDMPSYDYDVVGVDYTLAASFQPTEKYEKELNEKYQTANVLSPNGTVSGNISQMSDKDYYSIKTGADGRLSLSFSHTYNDSNDCWNVYVYMYHNGQYIMLNETRVFLNGDEKIDLPAVGVRKADTYYVVVKAPSYDYSLVGVDYTIKSSWKPTPYYEKEPNGVYANATNMITGKKYSGNLQSVEDKDCFRIIAPSSGYFRMAFSHPYINSNDGWEVCVYRYAGGRYTRLSSTNLRLNGKKKEYLPNIGMKKKGIYYVVVEASSRYNNDVRGVEYSIHVSPSSYGPKSIKLKVKKNKIKITWKKGSSVSGYEVYYRKGRKGALKKYRTTRKTSLTMKVKQGTIYYFKVRGYKIINKTKYYSLFSNTNYSYT